MKKFTSLIATTQSTGANKSDCLKSLLCHCFAWSPHLNMAEKISTAKSYTYSRHKPEETVLCKIIQSNWLSFQDQVEQPDQNYCSHWRSKNYQKNPRTHRPTVHSPKAPSSQRTVGQRSKWHVRSGILSRLNTAAANCQPPQGNCFIKDSGVQKNF